MGVWRKQTTRNGIYSKKWYGTIRTADGKAKQVPLAEDEATSEKLLKKLQSDQHERKANGTTQFDDARVTPLSELLSSYVGYLATKGNTPLYVRTVKQRLEKLFKALRAKTLMDLDSTRILRILSEWRSRKKRSISIETSNHYVTAVKSLSKWLQRERMTPDDILIALRKQNSQTDRRRVRRAFSLDELNKLCGVTQSCRKPYLGRDWRFTGEQRAMLYKLAAYTGLRASELASMTTSCFNFETKSFTIEAANAKNRKKTTLPLHPILCGLLPEFFTTLQTPHLFAGSWASLSMGGKMIKRDLKRCGIEYEDPDGRVLDFHSLRFTFVTSLAKAGVHPSKAQRLARHSTIHLTMSVYTQLDTEDLRDSLNSLPS